MSWHSDFNPIIVLFLTIARVKLKEDFDYFNPIIVLFLTDFLIVMEDTLQ